MMQYLSYSGFFLLCLIVGGRGGWSNSKFLEKIPQVHFTIMKEWPKNNPPLI